MKTYIGIMEMTNGTIVEKMTNANASITSLLLKRANAYPAMVQKTIVMASENAVITAVANDIDAISIAVNSL